MTFSYVSVSELILMTHLQLLYVRRIVPWVIFQEPFLQYVTCFWENLDHPLAAGLQGQEDTPMTPRWHGDTLYY